MVDAAVHGADPAARETGDDLRRQVEGDADPFDVNGQIGFGHIPPDRLAQQRDEADGFS